MTFDGKAFGQEIVGVVKAYVADMLGPINARLDAIERRLDSLPQPRDGRDGKDADPAEVAALVAEQMKAELDEIRAAIPEVPELPDIPALVKEEVAAAVSALPPPEKGEKGDKGDKGDPGEPGRDGRDGRDGLDVKDLFRAEGGHLIAVLSDGTTKDLGKFVGDDGKDGAPGRDGLGFDDLDLVEDDEGLKIRFVRGEVVKEFLLPVVIDRGVYKEGRTYGKGAGVTWGGSYWIATEETTERPGERGWRLAVKKGRDGKDWEPKDPAPQQPVKLR